MVAIPPSTLSMNTVSLKPIAAANCCSRPCVASEAHTIPSLFPSSPASVVNTRTTFTSIESLTTQQCREHRDSTRLQSVGSGLWLARVAARDREKSPFERGVGVEVHRVLVEAGRRQRFALGFED